MSRLYLDSNILIAYYSHDKAEETKKRMVEQALAVFAELKNLPGAPGSASRFCELTWAEAGAQEQQIPHR